MIIFALIITLIVSIISIVFIDFETYSNYFILIYMFLGFFITVISLIYFFVNRNKKMRILSYVEKNSDVIYYREPPFSYSPVIVTYIENLKLEINKDVIAELLFLSQKGYLYFEKSNSKNYILVKNNDINCNNLLSSQKYILSSINSRMNLMDFIELMRKNKRNLERLYEDDCYNLGYLNKVKDILKIKKMEKPLMAILIFPFAFLIISAVIFLVGKSMNMFKIIMILIVFYFNIILNFLPSLGMSFLIHIIFDRFILIRTLKAKEDYSKWIAFKDFLIDYTLIKNYNIESIDVLENYLTYAVALGVTKIDMK